MKKLILVSICLLFLNPKSKAQTRSGQVIYKAEVFTQKFQKELKNAPAPPSGNKSWPKQWLSTLKKAMPYLSFRLNFNKEEAFFEAPEFMDNDNGINIKRARSSLKSKGVFYTNIKENLILQQMDYLDKTWLINRKISSLDWKISKETKEIMGYRCYKATVIFDQIFMTHRKVTAWFCPALPFQYGPSHFVGLPGLVLDVKFSFYHIYATDIQLSKENKTIKRPKKGIPLSGKEFKKRIEKREAKYKGQYRGD